MNLVMIMGRLTKDPTINTTNDKCVSRFTVAVDRPRSKDGDQGADFISCVAFGKTAEFMSKYVTKGTKLVIQGHIQTGSYTNNEGQKIFTTDVIAEKCEFAESKSHQSAPSDGSTPDFMKVDESIDDEMPFN